MGSVGVDKSSRLPIPLFAFLDAAEGTVTWRRRVPAMMRLKELGRKPIAVSAVDILSRAVCENQVRHFMITFEAHQKLATLSSNRPRPNGKMRVIGSSIAVEGAKGGKKGMKMTKKAASVVNPRRRK